MLLAGELAAPTRIANLIAIGLSIFENLDRLNGAVRIQPQSEGDIFMLADDLVGDEPAAGRYAPDLQVAIAHGYAGSLFDGGGLFFRQALEFRRERRAGKHVALGLLNA